MSRTVQDSPSQKPPQLLWYPFLPLFLPYPQCHRCLAGPEPELHHHLAPHRDEIELGRKFRGAGVVQLQNPAPVAGRVVSFHAVELPGQGRFPAIGDFHLAQQVGDTVQRAASLPLLPRRGQTWHS